MCDVMQSHDNALPWDNLGITKSEWEAIAMAFYDLAHDDFRRFQSLPDKLKGSAAGALCQEYINTGKWEFVERAGQEITGTAHWFTYLGRSF